MFSKIFQQSTSFGTIPKVSLVKSQVPVKFKRVQSHEVYADAIRDYFTNAHLSPHVEHLVCLYFSQNTPIAISHIGQGTKISASFDHKDIFTTALISDATSFILAHNHPSGIAEPSDLDISITQEISLMGKFLQIEMDDHIILGKSNYFSFRDENMLN